MSVLLVLVHLTQTYIQHSIQRHNIYNITFLIKSETITFIVHEHT